MVRGPVFLARLVQDENAEFLRRRSKKESVETWDTIKRLSYNLLWQHLADRVRFVTTLNGHHRPQSPFSPVYSLLVKQKCIIIVHFYSICIVRECEVGMY